MAEELGRRRFYAIACPTCGAPAGRACRNISVPHAARRHEVERLRASTGVPPHKKPATRAQKVNDLIDAAHSLARSMEPSHPDPRQGFGGYRTDSLGPRLRALADALAELGYPVPIEQRRT